MLRIDQARAIPSALVIMLAASLTFDAASAKSHVKKPAPQQPSWEKPYAGATPPPVRFFTISAVLATHDRLAGARAGSVQLASADASTVANPRAVSYLPASVSVAPITSEEPFGLFAFRAPEGLLWQKWRAVETMMRTEASQVENCRSEASQCAGASGKFVALAASAGVADLQTRVEIINRNVNQAIRYVSDYEQHGVADLWSSPLETLAAGAGDCEDYAIAKFALLQDAGIPEKDLEVLLVRDMAVHQDHAVLVVRVEGRWLVLDNRRSAPSEINDLPNFVPLFAIDHRGVNLFAAPYAERPRHGSEMDVLPATDASGVAGGQTLPLLF